MGNPFFVHEPSLLTDQQVAREQRLAAMSGQAPERERAGTTAISFHSISRTSLARAGRSRSFANASTMTASFRSAIPPACSTNSLQPTTYPSLSPSVNDHDRWRGGLRPSLTAARLRVLLPLWRGNGLSLPGRLAANLVESIAESKDLSPSSPLLRGCQSYRPFQYYK
jgi:hypothetical protein